MSQSKRHSAMETATNTAVGFVGSYFITFACFHVPGADLATKTLYATLGCTVWSLLRGYFLRRLFNHIHVNRAAADAGMAVSVGYHCEELRAAVDHVAMIRECDCGIDPRPCTSCPNTWENQKRYCRHGEEQDVGCIECAEDYREMRRDDQRNYEGRG